MTQVNIIADTANVLGVPTKVLNTISEDMSLCIGSAIHEAVIKGEPAVVLNIGIGTLSVDVVTKQCKFIPSAGLKESINSSIDGNVDPLEKRLEQAIVDKLIALCDDAL